MSRYCIDCGNPMEASRQRSIRCRDCDRAKKAMWAATAPRCAHCGQILPKDRRDAPEAPEPALREGWTEHPDGGFVDSDGFRRDTDGRLMASSAGRGLTMAEADAARGEPS